MTLLSSSESQESTPPVAMCISVGSTHFLVGFGKTTTQSGCLPIPEDYPNWRRQPINHGCIAASDKALADGDSRPLSCLSIQALAFHFLTDGLCD